MPTKHFWELFKVFLICYKYYRIHILAERAQKAERKSTPLSTLPAIYLQTLGLSVSSIELDSLRAVFLLLTTTITMTSTMSIRETTPIQLTITYDWVPPPKALRTAEDSTAVSENNTDGPLWMYSTYEDNMANVTYW